MNKKLFQQKYEIHPIKEYNFVIGYCYICKTCKEEFYNISEAIAHEINYEHISENILENRLKRINRERLGCKNSILRKNI